jgi:hypothetical protein
MLCEIQRASRSAPSALFHDQTIFVSAADTLLPQYLNIAGDDTLDALYDR